MGLTVLIVDDHAVFRGRVRQLLEAEGYEVVGEASDGAAGVRAGRELHPEVVLLDVHLPDALGFDLVEAFSGGGDHPESAVVLISTHDEDAYRARARSCGARGFITKSELSREAIEHLLR